MSKEMRAARAAASNLYLDDKTYGDLTQKVKEAYDRIDGALAHTLRLNADMIETAQQIGLEPELGQKLFVDFNDCIDTMMTSRQKMVAAHTRATGIRMKTNQAETGAGCWSYMRTQSSETMATPLRSVA